MPPSVGRPGLGTFARALREAVHDASHEATDQAILHYWDTDLFYWSVFGIPDERSGARPESSMVSAMHAAGFFGPVHILASHRAELFRLVSDKVRRPPAELHRLAEQFIAENPSIDELVDAGRMAGELREEDSVEQFGNVLTALDEIPNESFVAIESLAHGSWPERLRRLLETRLLNVDRPGPDLPLIARDWRLDQIAKLLDSKRPNKSAQNAVDAAALTALLLLNEGPRQLAGQTFIRFHTASPVMRDILDNVDWIREGLAFPEDKSTGHFGSIVRDDYYYRLRAYLPNLNPRSTVAPVVDTIALDALAELSDELSALAAANELTEENVSSIVFNDGGTPKYVAELIDEFESANMVHIWLRYDTELADFSKDLVSGVENIRQLVRLEGTRSGLRSLLGEAIEDVVDGVHRAYQIARVVGALVDEIGHRARHQGAVLKSLTYDFAVVRWGIVVDPDEDHLEFPVDDPVNGLRDMVMVQAGDPTDAVRMAELRIAQLVGLDAFHSAQEMILRLADQGVGSPILGLLGDVCSLRLTTDHSLIERRCDDIIAGWALQEDLVKQQFTLGYAFLIADGAEVLLPERLAKARALARFSNDMLREVMPNMDSPERLFAINHIVYVSTIFDLESSDGKDFVQELETFVDGDIEEEPYRFLDTLGWWHLRRAEQELTDGYRRSAELGVATVYLRRAIDRAPFDSELAAHWNHLQGVAGTY